MRCTAKGWAGLLWAVFGLSVGAISLLLLIRRGAIAGVASLFYLVPPSRRQWRSCCSGSN